MGLTKLPIAVGSMLVAASTLLAQSNGWPTVDQDQQNQQQAAAQPSDANPYQNQQPSPPQYGNQDQQPVNPGNGNFPHAAPPSPYGQNPNPYAQQAPPPPIPAQLTLTPGTYITVRINQKLSSDHNHPGDAFTATLEQPLVVNGVVVAEPGETVGGVVSQVEKGSTAKLLIQLTDLSLIDGQSLPIRTQLVARRGPGFTGNDAGTIVGTTALGAAVGAAADWGTGAAIGSVAGLAVGALVTHNHPSVIYPEQMLTFRIQTAQVITTQNAPQAFHYVQPGEYDRPAPQGPSLVSAPPSPYYSYPYYAYAPYPYFWGPSIGFTYFGGGYRHYGYYGHGGGYHRR